ncbi:MAG: cytochrome c [Pseudomonadota bacterium]
MNLAFSTLLKSVLVATLAVSGIASAATPAAPAKADAAKGATLYDSGDAARGIPACVSCHGAAGNSTIATNPKLAGQFAAYTHKQLMDFTTPNRNNPIMTPISKQLATSPDDIRNIAAYLDAQTQKAGAAKNKDTVELGKKIYRGGIASTGVASCASCHGANGNGIPAQFPRLAGQHQDYTVSQLQAFKGGARKNSVQMTTISKRMSDEEMKAVADYIAGLK